MGNILRQRLKKKRKGKLEENGWGVFLLKKNIQLIIPQKKNT